MKFLIDKSSSDVSRKIDLSSLVVGQLLTPKTNYRNWGGLFAIDNGAFSGFDERRFSRLLSRQQEHKDNCIFVTMPDIVGNGRRTLELWRFRDRWGSGWPLAFVAQDGVEDLDIPWHEMSALFIGGNNPWKDSMASQDLVRTAKALGIHVHVGRVNTFKRFDLFASLGADTCDGSGVAMYDHMLNDIETSIKSKKIKRTGFIR